MSEQKSMKKSGQMISVAPASLKSRNLCGKERHKVITQQMLVSSVTLTFPITPPVQPSLWMFIQVMEDGCYTYRYRLTHLHKAASASSCGSENTETFSYMSQVCQRRGTPLTC